MIHARDERNRGQMRLKWTVTAWFIVVAIGQLIFISFILAHYGSRTVALEFAAWNDRPIIKGYVADDVLGNAMFIAHVLLAAVVTLGGLAQLVPFFRRRAPAFHRWNGRIYISIACFLALGGLWLTWGRGTMLSFVSALPVSLNGVLILLFASLAWRYGWRRQIGAHRRFALRTFVLVSGVWYLRVGLMGWVIINQGPRGMNDTMSGPADLALAFGSYLVPLAIMELYFLAQRTNRTAHMWLALVAVGLGTVFTAIGIFGAAMFMWWP